MRRFTLLVIIALIISLSGCTALGSTMTLVEEKEVTIISEYYDFEDTTLPIYNSVYDDLVPYVNIEEFVEFMDPALVDLKKSEIFGLKYSYPVEGVDENGNPVSFDLFIDINPRTDTITVNDISIFSYLNADYEDDYVFDFETETLFYEPGLTGTVFELGAYGFNIVLVNRNYYIPLFLANLFFTGDFLNFYDSNGTLYLTDDLTNDEIELSNGDSYIDSKNIVEHTGNYLNLVLDYFYGYEERLIDESYYYSLMNNNIIKDSSIEWQSRYISNYILSLEDLHTAVYDFGYEAPNGYTPNISYENRHVEFFLSYEVRQCEDKKDELYISEEELYYILTINLFTEDTITYLTDALSDINPNKYVFIDLSCNTGGMLGAVYDVISFMTDQPFTVNYSNSFTGEKVTEEITPNPDRKIDNQFAVYTSEISFSAANLFAQIVKENDIAPIFGHRTQGGANAVSATVLPNNMILFYSSNMKFTDSEFETIEYGVAPTIGLFDSDSIYDAIHQVYGDEVSVDFGSLRGYATNNSTPSMLDIDVHTSNHPSEYSHTEVQVFDVKTDDLITTYTSTLNDFNYTYDISEFDNIRMEVSVIVTTTAGFASKKIETLYVDDVVSFLHSDAPLLRVGESKKITFDYEGDVDYIKFNLTQEKIVKLTCNNNSNCNIKIYDINDNLVSQTQYTTLQSGTYYVKLDSRLINSTSFYLELDEVIESNPGKIDLDLTDGSFQFDLIFDYPNDEEFIYFEITEKSFLTFNFPTNNQYESFTLYQGDENLYDGSLTIRNNEDLKIILDPGSYRLETGFNDDISGTILVETYIGNDISGSIHDDLSKFGLLNDGKTTVNFETDRDRDIYIIEVEEDTVLFTFDDIRVYDKDFNELNYNKINDRVTLKAGINYVVLTFWEGTPKTKILAVLEKEQPSIENKQEINLDEAFVVSNYGDTTSAYYSFNVSEETNITFTNDYGGLNINALFNIYDSYDNLVFSTSERSKSMTLDAGDYYMRVDFVYDYLYIGEIKLSTE